MKVAKAIVNTWKLKREHGDIEQIHEFSTSVTANGNKISRPTIVSALETGRMSEDTFKAITKYYEEKARREQELINSTIHTPNI